MSYYFPVLGGGTITSGIGARASPGGVGSTNHKGIDIAAPLGTGVIAPTDLTILTSGWSNSGGNMITATDGNNIFKFMHLSNRNVTPGQVVDAGSLIGAVGSTGNSTGNHLHFAVMDKAGNLLNQATNAIVNKGVKLATDTIKNTTSKLVKSIPIVGKPVAAVTDALAITGDCSIICQLKNWIEKSQFFQRSALVILALIFLLMAFYLFGTGQIQKLVKSAT